MWRYKVILKRSAVTSGLVQFNNSADEPQFEQLYWMDRKQYDEMNSPEIITLTIETGDRLNPETSGAHSTRVPEGTS